MSTAIAFPNNTASTFLTHLFGSDLADDRYVVERFKAYADGDIRPWPGEAPAKEKRGARPKRVTATLKTVKELRPARTEIIICTGMRTRGGMQVWGVSRPRCSTTAGARAEACSRTPGRPRAGWASLARIPISAGRTLQ